jgi:hypothetical protein
VAGSCERGNEPSLVDPLETAIQALDSEKNQNDVYVCIYIYIRGGTVAKVLRYKSEGRWFDSRWCHCNFSLT